MRLRIVENRRDREAFIGLPYRLHGADPLWAPPLRRDVRTLLSTRRNPFFDHAQAACFLAEDSGGKVVGRVAAISNRLHNQTHGDEVGFFGFFETVDDPAVAEALLSTAGRWVRERGHRVLRGPTSFSVNDECGLLVEGFGTPPTLMMPHNPPYYAPLIESAGFGKVKDLWVYQVGHPWEVVPVPERLARGIERVRQRHGISLRSLDLGSFDAEVDRIRRLYNACWERNWGFVPLTDREVGHLAEQFRPVALPELAPFAEKDGEVLGFALALPDLNEVLRSNRSGRIFPAALKLLWSVRRHKLRRLRIVLLGIRPEWRGKGIDAMLYHWIWTHGLELGFRWGEAGWILEDNSAMNAALEKMGFARYKTYRLYERGL